MLGLEGDLVVFYSSTVSEALLNILLDTFEGSYIDENNTIHTGTRKFKMIDLDNMKTFRMSDIREYEKVFIVNIDRIDTLVLFELLVPMIKEVHANTVGGKSISKFKCVFKNIKY